MIYKARPGEYVLTSVANALLLADKYDRKVSLKFNGVKLKINKRLSIKHLMNTYNAIVKARKIRWEKSPEFKEEQILKRFKVITNQNRVNKLIESPVDKYQYGFWLSEYIDASDMVGVDGRSNEVVELLKNAGFKSEEHVGRDDLDENPKEMLEYVAGQVISMITSMGVVHPMLGQWASEVHEKLNGEKV